MFEFLESLAIVEKGAFTVVFEGRQSALEFDGGSLGELLNGAARYGAIDSDILLVGGVGCVLNVVGILLPGDPIGALLRADGVRRKAGTGAI